jgi:serine/threonine protein kinase
MSSEGGKSLIATYIGSYLIEKEIGEGSYGKVFLGIHPTIERKVAIKVLNYEFSRNKEIAGRFIVEAKAVNRIVHPNVIQVFDFGKLEDGRFFYIMEYVEGIELAQLIEKEGMIEMTLLDEIFSQIASGLDAAHKAGIVHRDLKPGNILVSRDTENITVKIFDFGIAKLLEGKEKSAYATGAGEVMGTPAYMAPEQARADLSSISKRTDVYALGAIVYQLLSGQLPIINDDSIAELMVAIIRLEPPLLNTVVSGIPQGLSEVIDKALSKNPKHRYPSAGEFYEAFRKNIFNPLLSLNPGINTSKLQYVRNKKGEIILATNNLPKVQKKPQIRPEKQSKRIGGLYLMATFVFLLLIIVGTLAAYKKRKRKSSPDVVVPELTVSLTSIGAKNYRVLSFEGTKFNELNKLKMKDGILENGSNLTILDFRKLKKGSSKFIRAAKLIGKANAIYISGKLLGDPVILDALNILNGKPIFISLVKPYGKLSNWNKTLASIPLYMELTKTFEEKEYKIVSSLPIIRGLYLNGIKVGKKAVEVISTLKNLEELSLNRAVIDVESISHLGKLRKLKKLYLRHAKIDSNALHFMPNLTNLTVLSLDHTKTGDSGLAYIKNLSKLRELHLIHTKITDEGIHNLATLRNLKILSLSYTNIGSKGLSYIRNLKNIEQISLGATSIDDSALIYLSTMKKLKNLYLYGTKISDAGLIHLSGIPNLEKLFLDSTKVTNIGMDILKWHLNLHTLSLSKTSVDIEGIVFLKRLSKLRVLDLGKSKTGCESTVLFKKLLPQLKIRGLGCN